VVHIDAHLGRQELAALYRSCDVGVFPYRAEGFVLPIAEAMASGTPSIVPDFGPCLDFCSASTSFLVPARRIRLPFSRTVHLAAGFAIDVGAVDFCEVRMDALKGILRAVFDAGREALADKRQAGIDLVRNRLTWATSVDRVEECLAELRGTVPRRIAVRREAAARAIGATPPCARWR
jgi:glycosyltransferase involved in cell wall biosynthesis